jgi:hypothetical protein
LVSSLVRKCCQAKEELSTEQTTEISLELERLQIDHTITFNREDFEQLCQDLFRQIDELLRKFSGHEKIDDVLLLGGCCKIPSVRERILRLFSRPPDEREHDFLTVRGAVLAAGRVKVPRAVQNPVSQLPDESLNDKQRSVVASCEALKKMMLTLPVESRGFAENAARIQLLEHNLECESIEIDKPPSGWLGIDPNLFDLGQFVKCERVKNGDVDAIWVKNRRPNAELFVRSYGGNQPFNINRNRKPPPKDCEHFLIDPPQPKLEIQFVAPGSRGHFQELQVGYVKASESSH